MVLDFRGEAIAVSSNPFWLLWPQGTKPVRHAPDFFVRRRNGSVLIVDVKPAERITDNDREQHDLTRKCCAEIGWEYEEFTSITTTVERNLRVLSGYHHPRFAPPENAGALIVARVRAAGSEGLQLAELVDVVRDCTGLSDEIVLCAVYHMLWNAQLHTDLNTLLAWDAVVRA